MVRLTVVLPAWTYEDYFVFLWRPLFLLYVQFTYLFLHLVYDDYKFVTKQDLANLGLSHLIGTNLLRAYMHGFFLDIRLYHKVSWLNLFSTCSACVNLENLCCDVICDVCTFRRRQLLNHLLTKIIVKIWLKRKLKRSEETESLQRSFSALYYLFFQFPSCCRFVVLRNIVSRVKTTTLK